MQGFAGLVIETDCIHHTMVIPVDLPVVQYPVSIVFINTSHQTALRLYWEQT